MRKPRNKDKTLNTKYKFLYYFKLGVYDWQGSFNL